MSLFLLDVWRRSRRDPNEALEATGHSVRFWVGVKLYYVARASAWALGCIIFRLHHSVLNLQEV